VAGGRRAQAGVAEALASHRVARNVLLEGLRVAIRPAAVAGPVLVNVAPLRLARARGVARNAKVLWVATRLRAVRPFVNC